MIRRLTLLGLGLLGGSVAKAARAEGLAREIVAVGRRRESLEPALHDSAVDRITTDVAEGVTGSDFCIGSNKSHCCSLCVVTGRWLTRTRFLPAHAH